MVSLGSIVRGRRGRLLIALLLTEFAASVTGLSYAAVLPVAAIEFDAVTLYAAAVSMTGIVGIAVLPLGAFLYGRVGPRVQLWAATAVYLGGVAVSAGAPSMWVLISGLALRGVSAGMMGGLGLGILSRLYQDSKERERALGLFAAMWVIPSLLGPVINSAMLATVGWRWSMVWPAILLLIGRALVSRSLSVVDQPPPTAGQSVRAPGSFAAIAVGLVVAQASVAAQLDWTWIAGLVVLVLVVLLPFRSALERVVPNQLRAQAGGWMLALVCGSYFAINALVPLVSATILDPSGVIGAILVSIGPLAWAGLSASGLAARIPRPRLPFMAMTAFPASALLVSAGGLVGTAMPIAGSAALALSVLLIGLAMGAIYPRVMTATFEGFHERDGTTRVHGGVVLGAGEDVGTAVGVTALAGVGGLSIGWGTPSAVYVCVGFAIVIAVLWFSARSSPLWDEPDRQP